MLGEADLRTDEVEQVLIAKHLIKLVYKCISCKVLCSPAGKLVIFIRTMCRKELINFYTYLLTTFTVLNGGLMSTLRILAI